MTKIIAVAVGGGVGALLRYAASLVFAHPRFPFATFIVNSIGCFLIGVLYTLFTGKLVAEELGLLAITGILGAFTTFSTFNLEIVRLVKTGATGAGLLYLVVSNCAGLLLVLAGMKAGSLAR